MGDNCKVKTKINVFTKENEPKCFVAYKFLGEKLITTVCLYGFGFRRNLNFYLSQYMRLVNINFFFKIASKKPISKAHKLR